ncbi:MAG: hypothetical protein GY816_18750 [Cytophagales bacterium]|nr:hypothetical protein [Cytophagales bacterium]
MKLNLLLIFLTFLVALGCAPNLSNPINGGYHDMTAHYNAYFIANEHIKSIEATLHNGYEWNYNKVLPIYAPFDSTDAAALKDQIEDCIEKSSIAIQRHPGSNWEFPSYILVGKARFYGLEFTDAVEAYKYVNTKSEDDNVRHEALINLIRTFTANKEFNNAVAVADYLEKEELDGKNKQYFYLSQAYLYQERENLDLMVQNLVKAEEIFTNSRDKARIQFIIGQVYQQLDFGASAFSYYKKSLKNQPSYELSFFTKLNMAQVTQLSEGKDIKTVRKYFKKLLVDRKNFEYNDKIYYELGLFEQKHGNLDDAIVNYKQSVKVSSGNNRQKGLSYLSLAKIYYDSLKNFEIAKNYYDSTVTTLPNDEDNYAAIKTRQEVLEEFVKHITTIRVNDSLVFISRLPSDSIRSLAIAKVTRDSLQRIKVNERKDRLARSRSQHQRSNSQDEDGLLINTGDAGTWYFDNSTTVSRGFSNFNQKWKNRPLEDNWRRSIKNAPINIASAVSEEPKDVTSKVKQSDAPVGAFDDQVKSLIGNIPRTDEQRQNLMDGVKEALYHLGNIYNFKLKEEPNAITTFLSLLSRFPKSEYEPEVLYQLYLLQKSTNPEGSNLASTRLTNQYPESIYARLIANPNYREESFAATIQLQEIYRRSYEFYERADYDMSLHLLDSALNIYPDNEFSDNIQLLKILNIGQLEGQHKYRFELDNFVKSYSESELLPYAETLIKTSDSFKANLFSSSKARYLRDFNQTHYFVLIYQNKEANSVLATGLLQSFIEENNLGFKSGNILLSDDYSIALINNIPDKGQASDLLTSFNQQMTPADSFIGEKHFVFSIAEDNFDILYRTKDIDTYQTFFDKYYP